MLSRIANYLFWMGRSIERAEHLARYAKVQFVSSLDAPMLDRSTFVLGSLLRMNGSEHDFLAEGLPVEEAALLYWVAGHPANGYSLLANVANARENARGARDSISTELWEMVNRYYHTLNDLQEADIRVMGAFDLARLVETQSITVKGYIENSLLRGDAWRLISLGLYLERAIQVTRILLTKMEDLLYFRQEGGLPAVESYLLSSTLKSAESFDMCKRYYGRQPRKREALEFLLVNPAFPKSVAWNLERVHSLVADMELQLAAQGEPLAFAAGKLASQLRYTRYADLEADPKAFLDGLLQQLYGLAWQLEQKYLQF